MPTAQNSVKPELTAAELELKRRGRRRLIGAVTMGVVAIVVLPMIFDAEPKRKDTARQEIEIQIPPKEGLAPLPTPVAPAASAADAAPKDQPKMADKAAPEASKPLAVAEVPPKPSAAAGAPADTTAATKPAPKADAKTESKPVGKADPKPEKKADTKVGDTSPAKAVAGGFVIQIGAYKDAENARSVVSRMKDAKLPVFTDALAVKTGTVTRVRVGPFPTKEKAESALAEVKLAGVDGKVVPLP